MAGVWLVWSLSVLLVSSVEAERTSGIAACQLDLSANGPVSNTISVVNPAPVGSGSKIICFGAG